MTPDEIRAALESNWLDRRDRARLEALLAVQPDHGRSAHGAGQAADTFEHIRIEGDRGFIAATKRALALLRGTSGWATMRGIARVRACDTGLPVGGALIGNTAEFEPSVWRGDAKFYASSLAHEGVHAAGADGSRDGERACMTVQARVLRELRADRATIDHIERHAANPTPFHTG